HRPLLSAHTRRAPTRHIVYDAMQIGRVVAEVVNPNIEHAALGGPPDDALGERSLHHRREDGDNVDFHTGGLRPAPPPPPPGGSPPPDPPSPSLAGTPSPAPLRRGAPLARLSTGILCAWPSTHPGGSPRAGPPSRRAR